MPVELPALVDCDLRDGLSCTHPDVTDWTPQTCFQCKLRTTAAFEVGKIKNQPRWRPLPPRTNQQPITTRPMRVGLLCDGWGQGGVEEWFRCLRKYADRDAVNIVAVGLRSRNDETFAAYSTGLPVYPHNELRDHVDVALCWDMDLSGWKRWPGRIVHVAHGATDWTALYARRHHLFADALVAVSEAAVKTYPEESQSRVHVIRNGVDLSRLPNERAPSPDTVIGYCGRWDVGKRPMVAARIAALHGARAVFLIPRAHVIQAKTELDHVGITYELWHVERIPQFYATVTACVAASAAEGYGLTMVEAMASGCPLIATSVGIIPELERDHGLLCVTIPHEPTDDDLRDCLSRIDPATVGKAREVTRTHCDARAMAREWMNLLVATTTG